MKNQTFYCEIYKKKIFDLQLLQEANDGPDIHNTYKKLTSLD